MQLDHLLTELLKRLPEYKAYIHTGSRGPASGLVAPAFHAPSHTELFRFDSDLAPAYINLLHSKLAQAHPEAGKIYWITTAWRTLTWAPIFFSTLAVHCLQKGLSLSGFGFRVTQDSIEGPSFADEPVFEGNGPALIDYSGGQIGQVFSCLHAVFIQCFPLNTKLAQKLFTDYVIQCLLVQNEHFPSDSATTPLGCKDLQTRLESWLSAAGLPVVNGFLQLPNGKPGLNRQACCQYYRVQGAEECEDCTRIPLKKRIMLMAEVAQ